MKKRSKLKSKLLSFLCSVGAMQGGSIPKTEGINMLSFLQGFNTLTKGLQNMVQLTWGIKSMQKAQVHNSKDRSVPWNPELCPELFEKNAAEKYGLTTCFDDAMSLILGRTKQKEILRKVSIKHLVNKSMNVPHNVSVIMAYGPSGAGKTKLIDVWERLFLQSGFSANPDRLPIAPSGICRIRPADIDFSNKKVSYWNQLLQNKKTSMGTELPIKSELVAYVEANPNGGIIDLDEADKFMDKSVQEGLRNMIDEGVLVAEGMSYPLDNYIIVIKGNMSPSSVNGSDGELTRTDIQSGLTSIDISQSLTKRMDLIPFESYSANELFSIFMSKLDDWERRYRAFGLAVDVPDSTKIALNKYLDGNNLQGRCADKLYKDLAPRLYEIGKLISTTQTKDEKPHYTLIFDEKSKTLDLVDSTTYGRNPS